MLEIEEAQNVGELLRNTRLKKGKTLGDVSKDLCIRKFYLEAIESMDAANLPVMPYGLGFVRSYADYLGLNSSRITQAYRQVVYAVPDEEKNRVKEAEETPQTEYAGPNLRHVLFGLLGVVLIFAVWRSVSSYNQQKQLAEENEVVRDNVVPEPVIIEENESAMAEMGLEDAEPETLSEQPETAAEENKAETKADKPIENVKVENETKAITESTENTENTENKTAAESEPASASVTPTKVQISFAGPSWLELKQGNKVLLSGIYGKGFKYDVPNESGIIVSVGRYYNVDFYVDGKLTKVASAMKQTNISLDKYILPEQKQE